MAVVGGRERVVRVVARGRRRCPPVGLLADLERRRAWLGRLRSGRRGSRGGVSRTAQLGDRAEHRIVPFAAGPGYDTVSMAVSGLVPAALWERESALRSVRRLIETVLDGSGGSLFVVGEAGLGKTSVLAEGQRLAASQVRVGTAC